MKTEIRLWGDLCRRQTQRHGDKVAFINTDGQKTTFAGFESRINRINNSLAGCGLVKGDRVAILAKNRTEYVETYGLAKTGLVVVPLNWRLTGAEILALLLHCQPAVVIADDQHVPVIDALREQLNSVRLYVRIGETQPNWINYETLVNGGSESEPAPTCPLDPEDVVCLMYTSGTTGLPKGVGLSHRGILGNARASGNALKLSPQDRTLAAMPLFHVGGMWYHLHASYAAGCTSSLLAGFDVKEVIQQLQTQAITNIHLVPTMIGALLADPGIATADLQHLRIIFYAASSIPAELLKQAITTFSKCEFIQAYGSTEAGIVTALFPEDHIQAISKENECLLTSCGRALEGVEIRVVDDNMNTLPPGEVGEIAIHGDCMMAGYWKNPEATAHAFCNGWFRSGDMGHMDDDSYIFLKDRKNDMIVTGGENVYPSEVENVLYRHPAVLQAAVFGIPDPLWVEKVVAAVVIRPGMAVNAKEIISGLRKQLATYKCPKEVFLCDQLPMNAAGKILRRNLKKQFANTDAPASSLG